MDRVIFDNNGTLTDLSQNLNLFASGTGTIDYVTAQDYIYIGSDLPFNHKFFDITTANTTACTVTIEYWDGSTWQTALDVQDNTISSGASMGQAGHIQWTPDKDKAGWAREDTEDIPALATLNIYGLYWMRMSFSDTFSPSLVLNHIGYKFAEDANIGTYYPELVLSNTYTQFESGKTDWNEQHFAAAYQIIRDLKKKGIILNRNQILNWQLFTEAGVHKVAELIFNAFGDDFRDNRKDANHYYSEALSNVIYDVDKDNNARLDLSEKLYASGFMKR